MSATFEPGTVAVATVRGVPNVRVVLTSGTMQAGNYWVSVEYVEGCRMHAAENVTDVRPLVVLDLDQVSAHLHPNELARGVVPAMLRDTESIAARKIAEQIEAQTKPPRIPEPGPWGVVQASVETHGDQRGRFVRDGDDPSGHWECIDWPGTYGWTHLVDPVEIRAGIEGGA